MHSVAKTLSAAILGFAIGGGAATGGLVAYHQMTKAQPDQASTQNLSASANVASSSPNQTLSLGPQTIPDVVKRVGPAVVKIVATVPKPNPIAQSPFFNPFFGSIYGNNSPQLNRATVQTDIGSGFFFDSKGDILTNDHVIRGATKIQVYVPGYKQAFVAKRVGTDYATDLAVLKINPPKPMPYLSFGNTNTTPVGAWDIAIGNPYDLSSTVTVGVVSAKGRPLTIGHRNYKNLLQTSAAINPGNSGGPLLNLKGQVIGINTAVESQAQGIGFAIPTTTVQKILPQLMKNGHVSRPWLGVFITTDSSSFAQQYNLPTSKGVVVINVEPGSPAEQAGLTPGDVITKVDGNSVTTAAELENAVKSHSVGSSVQLTVNHQGTTETKTVTLAQEPNGPITMNQQPSSTPFQN